jgi:hypothetical protein
MKIANTLGVLVLLAAGLGCGYSKKTTPPTPGQMPAISQLSPSSTAAGSAQFTMEVDGSNFSSNATVSFGTAQVTTQFSSAGKLEATIPSTAVMNSGTVHVTVTNPGTPGGMYGGGTQPATSAPVDFTVN